MRRINLIIHIIIISIFSNPKCYGEPTYNGTIAGNLSISQCINGYRPENFIWEQYVTPSEFIREAGYPVEEHIVETEDGYLLTMHRIPGAEGAPPVLLQHGLLCSSFDFVVNGKEKSLPYILADKGYDVWMGNLRGNTYSRCHTKYTTSDSSFWDYSWHEHGVYDVPAFISYVTNINDQDIIFVGHSMGTTVFYVMAIERPDIASRVKAMYGMAPIAYIYYLESPVRLLSRFVSIFKLYWELTGKGEWAAQSPAVKSLVKSVCSPTIVHRKLCTNLLFLSYGLDPAQANYTTIPLTLYHTPAGTSLKTWIHFFQEENSGLFERYDYGAMKNLETYGTIQPPQYNISEIQVPMGIIWSENDYFVHPKDVERFYDQVPNKILNYKVPFPEFNHLDYLWAIDADKYVYDKLVSEMENYR